VPLPHVAPSDSLVIRHRRSEDLDACLALLRRVHERDRYPVRWPADPAAFLTPADELVAWVATRGDTLVGHVMLAATPEGVAQTAATSGVRAVVLLRLLFVAPEVRGQDLGARLLDIATAEAAARRRRAVLEVLSLNQDAIAVYERTGWTAIGTTSPDWAPEGTHAVVYLAPG
jgi:GNAT superfamily N-acetyltransferase